MSVRLSSKYVRRCEMRFMSPFGARQSARDKAFADERDLGIGME